MAGHASKQWGMFPPLSTALPTEQQLSQNDSMIDELKRQNNFEAPAETERRSAVLATLQKITVEFVKVVGRKKGMTETQLKEAGGKVATFGSFRLGVFGPGSDIDTLVVAPKHVSRQDFFDHFPSLLESMSPDGAIEEMKQVPDAHVPIIKLEYSGISIDLIFARLLVSSVPFSFDLKEDNLLRGLEEVEQRCLNGTRVSDMITSLVPQEKTFRHTLRTIKLWAQRRAIYANVMGFPGGVAWALMVACVCQMYPQACGSVVVGKFFNLMGNWAWPRPVQIKKIDDNPPGMSAKIWNPVIYRADKNHLMPIITPAYPSMCATHNITRSTQKVILKELKRAEETTKQIHDGKKQWSDLFAKHSFFTSDYKYYLSIVSASKTKEAQLIWSGLVESKVRRLVASIEESQPGISIARPFTKGFDRIHHCKNEEEINQVLIGKLDYLVTDSKAVEGDMGSDIAHVAVAQGNADNVEMPTTNGEERTTNGNTTAKIYTTTYYIGIELAEGSKSLDISYSVQQYQTQCYAWPQYNPDLNSVKVIHTRNFDLPPDVFDEGEIRPTKTKKTKTTTAKRSFSAAEIENSPGGDTKRRQQPNGSANASYAM